MIETEFMRRFLSCTCGRIAGKIEQIDLTPDHQLDVIWFCPGCAERLHRSVDLPTLWQNCPPSAQPVATSTEIPPPLAQPITNFDLEFAASVGFALGDPDEGL